MTMTSENTRQLIGNWIFKNLLKFNQRVDDESLESFTKALLIAAKGDQELSQAERDWVIGLTAAKGASEELIEKLKTYEADEDLDQVVSSNSTTNQGRRSLIYQAIQACDSDGEYSPGEKASIRGIAAKLEISEDVVQKLEMVYQEEKELLDKKIKLLFPEGTPL
jgi:tellurite resistance protein